MINITSQTKRPYKICPLDDKPCDVTYSNFQRGRFTKGSCRHGSWDLSTELPNCIGKMVGITRKKKVDKWCDL